jgi:hypothetical protein
MPFARGEWARSVVGSFLPSRRPASGSRPGGPGTAFEATQQSPQRTEGPSRRSGEEIPSGGHGRRVHVERGSYVRLKSGVTLLALWCLLLAVPVQAAKITIGDQGGFVDVGVIAQTWARMTENGNAAHTGVSTDFFFRRMRFYVNGAINEHIGIIANTDVSYTQAGAAASDVITNPLTQQTQSASTRRPS